MSESEARPPTDQPVLENEEKKLKYLDFVLVATVYVIICCSALYEYAKENSGPLKPGVQTIEGTVRTVIGPVYEKLHNVPFQLLEFVDRKVDESIIELDHHVPAIVKQVTLQASTAAHKASKVASELVSEVQRNGLIDTAAAVAKTIHSEYEPTVKEIYANYEPVAEQYAVTAWRSLNRLPLFSQVARIMVPTVAYWAEKYNQAVAYAAESGYTLSYYMPLVPVERIAKTFGAENEAAALDNGEYVAVSS